MRKLFLGGMTSLLFLLFACQASSLPPTPSHNWQAKDKIWVITDLHYLSPKLFNQGEAFSHIQRTATGKDLIYGQERMEMLLHQIKSEQPKVLIISGDLTLNGEYQSMIELQDYFKRIEDMGTEVYVIPGNHDISSGWASQFIDDETQAVKQVLPEDFKMLFADFGYSQAQSSSQMSLSYRVDIAKDLSLLMLDSNNYSQTEGQGAPTTGGDLEADTLSWVKQELEKAKSEQRRVLPVIHHNSLSHFAPLSRNYTLENANDFREILNHYQIPVTLSGHIHAQHIQEQDGITDIVTGAFSISPVAIGEITLTSEQFHYERLKLDSRSWSEIAQPTKTELTDIQAYMKDVFEQDAKRMMYGEMIDGNWYKEGETDSVATYFGQLNHAFFAGELSENYDLLTQTYQKERALIDQHATSHFKGYLDLMAEEKNNNHLSVTLHWPKNE